MASTISRSARAAASSRSKQKTVTFGASDMPLEPKDVTASGLVQFPTVVGGDVPVVNLDGIGPAVLFSTARR